MMNPLVKGDCVKQEDASSGRVRKAPENFLSREGVRAVFVEAKNGLPEHATGLGQGVATEGYGKPSKFETNVQRRQSPGLTQTTQASVSFAPLQSLFGIVTPSGLHFERHHQGWWDIDPSKHRFMVNGMVKTPKVFTMDEIMRLPSVSRFHFIECGDFMQRIHRGSAHYATATRGRRPEERQVCAGRGW